MPINEMSLSAKISNTNSLLGNIGNTPLVDAGINSNDRILAKLEYLYPGGSIKDRAA